MVIATVLGGEMVAATRVRAAAAPPTTSPNLIRNGNAEASLGSPVPEWTVRSGTVFETQAYGQGGFPEYTDPGPVNRGAAFFAGGLVPVTGDPNERVESAGQTRSVTAYASSIDAGTASFNLTGWLGGYSAQRDYATLTVRFVDAANTVVGSAMIGPVTPSDRQLQKGLLKRVTTGAVPTGTRKVNVLLVLRRLDGSYDDGYADNLSLTITTR